MQATFVTRKNRNAFIMAVPPRLRRVCDVLIGAIDETTDTACGILAAEAVGNRALSVRFLYVDEEFRRKGAATAMLGLLAEFAGYSRIERILCPVWETESDPEESSSEGLVSFLSDYGFVWDEDAERVIYKVPLASIPRPDVKGRVFTGRFVPVSVMPPTVFQNTVGPWARETGCDKEHLAQDISLVAFDEDGQVCGAVLFSMSGKEIYLEALEARRVPGTNGANGLSDVPGLSDAPAAPDDGTSYINHIRRALLFEAIDRIRASYGDEMDLLMDDGVDLLTDDTVNPSAGDTANSPVYDAANSPSPDHFERVASVRLMVWDILYGSDF